MNREITVIILRKQVLNCKNKIIFQLLGKVTVAAG